MKAVCRTCLGENAQVSVFEATDEVAHNARIARCVGVTVEHDDGLPQRLCAGCVQDLIHAYRFALRAEAADRTLRAARPLPTLTATSTPPDHDLTIKLEQCDETMKQETNVDRYDDDFQSENLRHGFDDTKECKIKCEKAVKKKEKITKKVKRGKMGPIQCVVCGLMTVCRSAMETHMRTHTGEKPFACQSCNLRFPTKGALKRHITTNHSQRERKFTCETCGNRFYTKSDIITHIRIHTNEKPYVCPFCSKSFRQIASLIRHKRVHTGEKPYPCHVCGKKFADRHLVTKHLNVHSNEKKFSCHLCNKSMKTKTALNTHLSLHSNEKRNICSFCGMAFAMKGNLQTHMRRVHSEKSGQCSVCLRAYSDLAEHMRKHTGERPFVCAECGQAFASRRALAHHTAFRHENAAKYKCSVGDCARCFPTALMLQFHLLKTHTRHTPFVCGQCARGFYRASDLSRHLKVSHAATVHVTSGTGTCTGSDVPVEAILEPDLLKLQMKTLLS